MGEGWTFDADEDKVILEEVDASMNVLIDLASALDKRRDGHRLEVQLMIAAIQCANARAFLEMVPSEQPSVQAQKIYDDTLAARRIAFKNIIADA